MKLDLGILKDFGKNLVIGTATEIVRSWLNEKLKNVSPSDLYEAVINDADLWSLMPENVKQEGLNYKTTYGGLLAKYEDLITTETLLIWIKEDHPDLFSTLINIPEEYGQDAGILWFDKQVRVIKQQLIDGR